jgi:8-oxo-dGTP pyrophosphatase MutT (NUDIX family)
MPTRTYTAAGGLVARGPELLLLHKHRQDEYVLPKGHIEAGESPEAAALRETREETGYANLRVLADLGTLHSSFDLDGERVERDETYFLMELLDETPVALGSPADRPRDRETFRRLWLPAAQVAERLTFEPARTFARRAAAWLAQHRR